MYTQGNVTVMVADMDRAVQFYTETLGLKLQMRWGNHWATIEAPGVTIGLHPAGEHGEYPQGQGNLSIGLGVENLDSAMAELSQKGVQFTVHDDEMVRVAYFSDPDGTPLYLLQMKSSW